MTRTYEGLFILDTAGKDEGAKELVEKVEREIQAAGGKINKVERMDKRQFARIPGSVDSGYYVNVIFNLDPTSLPALTNKFKLDEDIYRVMFLRPEESTKKSKAETLAA